MKGCVRTAKISVNIFRNQSQYGSKKTWIAFGHIALKPLKIFSSAVG